LREGATTVAYLIFAAQFEQSFIDCGFKTFSTVAKQLRFPLETGHSDLVGAGQFTASLEAPLDTDGQFET